MSEAKLYGLVLAGGQSQRMGTDKGLISYHGKPQRQVLFDMAKQVCERVYYSIRKQQGYEFGENSNLVIDQDKYRGPFNGLLSAHQKFPDVAWLVIACDLPHLDLKHLQLLKEQRDPSKLATALSSEKGLPEPLIAIWEPSALAAAVPYLKTAQSSCPRKFLLQQSIKLVTPLEPKAIYNANTIEEKERAAQQINQ